MGEWIKKIYTRTIEYYSTIKGINTDTCYNMDEC